MHFSEPGTGRFFGVATVVFRQHLALPAGGLLLFNEIIFIFDPVCIRVLRAARLSSAAWTSENQNPTFSHDNRGVKTRTKSAFRWKDRKDYGGIMRNEELYSFLSRSIVISIDEREEWATERVARTNDGYESDIPRLYFQSAVSFSFTKCVHIGSLS